LKIPLDGVLRKVAAKVTPTQHERDLMNHLSVKLQDAVGGILTQAGFNAKVSVQGSVAKDTWLHNEGDLDIFASFPENFDRGEWEGRVLPSLRKGLSRYHVLERYAEHPYLELEVDSVKVNIVPCYQVEQGKWKSATDRTPFHTTYMQQHLTDQLRLETRILKKFMKGVGVYGAEIRIGGFSGMLVETLTLKYGSFQKTLSHSSDWRNGAVIEIKESRRGERELIQKFDSPLVVVDPIDPNRNLAAAVRTERLWEFVEIARQFQEHPGISYFYPRKPQRRTRQQLLNRLKKRECDFVVALFPHSELILDILWGQLYSLEKSLVTLIERHQFRTLRSTVWGDADRISGILIAVETARLPQSQIHLGPPVDKRKESKSFLNKHIQSRDTISGPWIRSDRWMVEKRRQFPNISKLIVASARNRQLGLSVPAQLENGFRKRVKVLLNEEALSICQLSGFAQTLWKFMDGKPAWLETHQT
jgi:tRNA nucleotidyltransferase (CCA-adding enzyme)